jgi:hypothetical protein
MCERSGYTRNAVKDSWYKREWSINSQNRDWEEERR